MNKRLFVGVDEAGYGPNLGPLLVCGTAWLAPADMTETTFCRALDHSFRPNAWRAGSSFVPLGDSKKLFLSGGGIETLEIGLLALLSHVVSPFPQTLQSLLAASAQVWTTDAKLPWYDLDAMSKHPVPVSDLEGGNREFSGTAILPPSCLARDEIERLSEVAHKVLTEAGIKLVDQRAVVVTEPYFNEQVSKSGSKGQLLSQTTLQLVAEMLAKFPDLSAEVYCDRQGGRKNYMPVLLDAMPDRWFTEVLSSNARCSYRSHATDENAALWDIHFSVGGDSFPPTALASMLAKYLRERSMGLLNRFWQHHLPNLRATAGYPVDAKRYRKEIEDMSLQLGMPPELWWRCK